MTDLENICRACLKSARSFVHFDEKVTKTNTIVECFENLTSIKTKPTEIDPKICKKCFEKLKSAYEFKQQCIENDAIYQDLLAMAGSSGLKEEEEENIEVFMIKNENYSSDENQEMIEVEVEPGYVPKKLAKKARPAIKKEPDDGASTSRKVSKSMDRYACTFCQKLFTGQYAKKTCAAHERKMHINKMQSFILEDEDPDFVFNCAFCEETTSFSSWKECDEHEISVHRKYFSLVFKEFLVFS